jgi:hypothetical protein
VGQWSKREELIQYQLFHVYCYLKIQKDALKGGGHPVLEMQTQIGQGCFRGALNPFLSEILGMPSCVAGQAVDMLVF